MAKKSKMDNTSDDNPDDDEGDDGQDPITTEDDSTPNNVGS